MKKALSVLGIFLAVFLLILGGLYLYLQGSFKHDVLVALTDYVKKETDIKISFGDVKFDFPALLRLKPTLAITQLKIGDAIDVEELNAELELRSLLDKKLYIKKIILDKSILRFEENSKREVFPKGINLTELQAKLEKEKKKRKDKKKQEDFITDFNLKEFIIKDSTYEFTPYKTKKPIVLNNFNLELSDFVVSDQEEVISKLKMTAEFFGVKSSNISCNADLGPIGTKFNKLPINGKFSINIKLQDLPQDLKSQILGNGIKVTSGSELKYDSSLTGDVLDIMHGSGNLKVNDLLLGNTADHTIAVNTTIPLGFSINMIKNPNLSLVSNNAKVTLKDKNSKSATLTANTKVNVNLETMYMSGSGSGDLSGLEIEEALNCFTNTRKVVSGVFAINNYNFRFAGIDAKQINKSFIADGQITIKDGSLYILKNITKYNDLADAIVKNGSELTEKISGEFATLSSKFHLENNLLQTDDILIHSSVADITGAGSVRSGQWIVYDVVLNSEKLPSSLPMKIRGTISKPSIYPDLEALAKLNKGKVVQTALQQGLNYLQKTAEKNSKLKGLSDTLNTLQNGRTQTTTPQTVNGTTTQTQSSKQILEQQLGTALQGLLQQGVKSGVIKPTTTNGTTTAP